MIYKKFMSVGALLGAFAVAFGAFGAHGLKQHLSAEDIAVYQTGVQYHFYHVFAIFITSILLDKFYTKSILWAARLFVIGILIFSGSLYLMTYIKAFTSSEAKWLGAITPLGGTCFIIGWLLLGWGINKAKNE